MEVAWCGRGVGGVEMPFGRGGSGRTVVRDGWGRSGLVGVFAIGDSDRTGSRREVVFAGAFHSCCVCVSRPSHRRLSSVALLVARWRRPFLVGDRMRPFLIPFHTAIVLSPSRRLSPIPSLVTRIPHLRDIIPTLLATRLTIPAPLSSRQSRCAQSPPTLRRPYPQERERKDTDRDAQSARDEGRGGDPVLFA